MATGWATLRDKNGFIGAGKGLCWQRGWHLFAQTNLFEYTVAGSYFPFQIWSNPEAEAVSANIFNLCLSIGERALNIKWLMAEQVSPLRTGCKTDNQFSWCFVFKCVSNVYKGNVFYLTCSEALKLLCDTVRRNSTKTDFLGYFFTLRLTFKSYVSVLWC